MLTTLWWLWIAYADQLALASFDPRAVASTPSLTPPPTPTATDISTLGWYSKTITQGQTTYAPWTYNAAFVTFTSSSKWMQRCQVSGNCPIWTACSSGFLVAEGTSTYCGLGDVSGPSFCSSHIIYTTQSAASSWSWLWCDNPPLKGTTFFMVEPEQPTPQPLITVSAPTTTATITSSSSLPTYTAGPSDSRNDKTNVGAIAGSVVGGLAVLGAMGFALFFLLHRNKTTKAAPTAPFPLHRRKSTNGAPTAPFQPPMDYPPPDWQSIYPQANPRSPSAYQANTDAKPLGIQEHSEYYQQHQPAPYPQGSYDPYVGVTNHTGTSSPPQASQQPHNPQRYNTQSKTFELPATCADEHAT